MVPQLVLSAVLLVLVNLEVSAFQQLGDAQHGYSDGVEIADFDAVAADYVRRKSQEYGRSVSWWDLYGKHSHLQERPEYHKYKMKAWSDDVQYGQVTKTIEKPGYVYSQWFHNAQSVPLVTEFHRQVELRSTYTWSVSSSVKMNTEIKATAGIPDYLGVNAFFNSSVDLQDSRSQTRQEKEMYSVKNIVTIPPGKSVKAEFVVTEKDVEVPWEAEVELEGWIAIWFSEKHDGHWLWFHPISFLAGPTFPLTDDGRRLHHRAKGTFRGMRGVDTSLKTYEYDLIETKMAPQKKKEMKPIRVTELKPNMIRLY